MIPIKEPLTSRKKKERISGRLPSFFFDSKAYNATEKEPIRPLKNARTAEDSGIIRRNTPMVPIRIR